MSNIERAFKPLIEELRIEMLARMDRAYDRAVQEVQEFDPTPLSDEEKATMSTWQLKANSPRQRLRELEKENAFGLRYVKSNGYHRSRYEGIREGDHFFNEEFAQREAKQFAEAQFASFVAKFTKKIGDPENITVNFKGGGNCTLIGNVNGHAVKIDQSTVWKVSSRGTHYCQFPALIYVDGKRVFEKNYTEAVS